jgi:hypothetical protein
MNHSLRAFLAPLLVLILPLPAATQEVGDVPDVVLKEVPFSFWVLAPRSPGETPWRVTDATGAEVASGSVSGYDSVQVTAMVAGPDQLPLNVEAGDESVELDPTLTAGWFSLLPPLLAILLALLFREVITALVAGVWLGALAVAGFNPVAGLWRMMDQFIVPAVAHPDHAAIIVFSLMLGGMVGIVARNGGTSPPGEDATAGKAGHLAGRHGHLLRRLCQHADRGKHHAAHHGPPEGIPGEAGVPGGLHGGTGCSAGPGEHLGGL